MSGATAVADAFVGDRSAAVAAPARTPAALQLATTLAVYAVYAPPLLLWSRTPSLRWLRGDTVISLQRFDISPATGRER